MQIDSLSYAKLPFSRLFSSYIEDFDQLSSFYAYDPFDESSFRQRCEYLQKQNKRDREALVETLIDFNSSFQASDATIKNIERLKEPETQVIVTGQQVNLLGGPLYTVYKTISAIHLAEYWEQKLERPVIPVFWLADEDHDYEEIQRVAIPKGGQLFDLIYNSPADQPEAVSQIELDADYNDIRDYLKQELGNTDFSDDLWSMIDAAYKEGHTLGYAFGRLMLSMFSGSGLILAGSNNEKVKQYLTDPLKQSVTRADKIRKALDDQTKQLEEAFHKQVKLYDSNLFLHSEEDGRIKIHRNDSNSSWFTGNGHEWSDNELVEAIDLEPERFSPNVFLRPVLQDKLLPTLAYVGGPGELAYYGQMKEMYKIFDLEMPIIFPRLSATVVESKIDRILQKLPFQIEEYKQRIEDLESAYAREAEEIDIEALFDQWKKQVQELSDEKSEKIRQVDPTLVKAVGKATAVYFNELDKLKGKVHRSTKEQEEIQLNRIRKIKFQLFPENTLQERVISYIFYMNKYGVDLWDRLRDELSFDLSYREHQIIYL